MRFSLIVFLLGIFVTALVFYLDDHVFAPAKTANSGNYLRVVSLAPSYSETMQALGQAHRLVGVTIHCEGDDLKHLARIGSFAQANFEAIMKLKPDLVLAVPHVMATDLLKQLKVQNIEVFSHQPDSLDDIYYITKSLADKFGLPEKGKMLRDTMEEAIENAHAAVKAYHANTGAHVLIVISHEPLVVAGKNSFPSQIIERIGFRNMAKTEILAWPLWPIEKIMSEPPQAIIITQGKSSEDALKKLFARVNIDTNQLDITIYAPKLPILNSPSPKIIDDINMLKQLFSTSA
jgi:iron complex transport system substrate-binding protein